MSLPYFYIIEMKHIYMRVLTAHAVGVVASLALEHEVRITINLIFNEIHICFECVQIYSWTGANCI